MPITARSDLMQTQVLEEFKPYVTWAKQLTAAIVLRIYEALKFGSQDYGKNVFREDPIINKLLSYQKFSHVEISEVNQPYWLLVLNVTAHTSDAKLLKHPKARLIADGLCTKTSARYIDGKLRLSRYGNKLQIYLTILPK